VNILNLNLTCSLPKGVVLVPFIPEHLNGFEFSQPDMQGHDDIHNHTIAQARGNTAITVIQYGKTLGIFGSAKVWSGLEEAWFLVDEVTRQYGIAMTKVAKKFISLKFQEDKLNRLQITVRCDDTRAYKWAKCLGFQTDGVMKQFGPDGSNYYMMAVTKD